MDDYCGNQSERLTLTGGLPISEMIGWGMGGIAMYTSAQSYQRFGAAKGGADIRAAYTIMMFIGVAMCAMMVLTGMAVSVAYPDLMRITTQWHTGEPFSLFYLRE